MIHESWFLAWLSQEIYCLQGKTGRRADPGKLQTEYKIRDDGGILISRKFEQKETPKREKRYKYHLTQPKTAALPMFIKGYTIVVKKPL